MSLLAGRKRRAGDDDAGSHSTSTTPAQVTAATAGGPAAKKARAPPRPTSSSSRSAQNDALLKAAHEQMRAMDDEQGEASAATTTAGGPKMTPAAALAGLRTTSLDALRIVLTDMRALTALGAGEQTDLIPPTDARQVFAAAVTKGGGDGAGDGNDGLNGARLVFDAWELAEQRGAHTLIPIIHNVLANLLRLLSMHSPTHALGDAIIRRMLPARSAADAGAAGQETFFNRTQGYIAGIQRPDTSAGNANRPSAKGFSHDALVISSLRLLADVVSFAGGKWAKDVFDNFNWGLKTLSKLLSTRRRQYASQKRKAGAQQAQPASISRPDTRTAFLLFYLSFLRSHGATTGSTAAESSSRPRAAAAKMALLALPGKEFHTPLLKGLAEDAPSVVAFVLEALHSGLLSDTALPRAAKLAFFNEWNCAHLLALYQRQWELVPNVSLSDLSAERPTIAETAPKRPSVAELAHHFMLSLCTHPGFGICFRDDAWYPRDHHRSRSGHADVVLEDDEDKRGAARAGKDGLDKSQADGSLYNKVLLGVLRHLAPTRSLPQQELAIRILGACPELVGPYLTSVTSASPAGIVISLEPRAASSSYVTALAWLKKVFDLPIPTFAAPPSEQNPLDDRIAHRPHPPPLPSTLASLLPTPLLSKAVLMRACFHPDRLVRHQASSLLVAILDRIRRFNEACERASRALGEDLESLHRDVLLRSESDAARTTAAAGAAATKTAAAAWAAQCRDVQQEARKVLPDLDSFIAAVQSLGQPQRVHVAAAAATAGDGDGATTPAATATHPPRGSSDSLLLEVNLRVLWLYFAAVPLATFDSTFDVGKLLHSRLLGGALPEGLRPPPTGGEGGDGSGGAGAEEADKARQAEAEAEEHIQRLSQLHVLRIISSSSSAAGAAEEEEGGSSASAFVKNAVGGGLGLERGSFDIFARAPSSSSSSASSLANALATAVSSTASGATSFADGSPKTYFAALLSLAFVSSSLAVRETCQDLLRSAVASSVLFQHDRREWDAWMLAFARGDESTSASDDSAQASRHAFVLSDDQAIVFAFLDECLTRTLKTPYRYIEVSRRALAEDDDANATGSQRLAGSPLLHCMLEQFCIRCRKGILDGDKSARPDDAGAERDSGRLALLGFFNSLVLLLAARGIPFVALRRLGEQLAAAAEAEEGRPTSAVRWASRVLVANLGELGRSHPRSQINGHANGSSKKNSKGDFAAKLKETKDVAAVRAALRTQARPLTHEQLDAFKSCLLRLGPSAPASLAQLVCELHPTEERLDDLNRALKSTASDAMVPILLHVPSSDAAKFLTDHQETIPSQVRLLAAMCALARMSSHVGGVQTEAASSREDVELFEAAIRAGLDDADLRHVIFESAAIRTLTSSHQEASTEKEQGGVLVALASAMNPADPGHRALMADVAANVVRRLVDAPPAKSKLDLGMLKSGVLLLPFCDDGTLSLFVQGLLGRVLVGEGSGGSVLASVIAAVQRALVLSRGPDVALTIVDTVLGPKRQQVEPERLLASAELMDVVNHANATLTPDGLIAESRPGKRSSRRTGPVRLSLDHEFVERVVTAAVRANTAVSIAPLLYHSKQASLAVWRSLTAPDGRGTASAHASVLYAALDVASSASAASTELLAGGKPADTKRLADELATALFGDDADPAMAAAAILTSLAKAMPTLVDQVCGAILQVLPAKDHRRVFNEAVIGLATAFLQLQSQAQDEPKPPASLLTLCRKVISSSLLWLVRRFAEDAEDSAELLDTLTAFRRLLTRSADWDVEVPASVAEPVIEAGLTRRWHELEPMKLVCTLCKRVKLGPASVDKVVGRLAAAMSVDRLLVAAEGVPAAAGSVERVWTRTVCAMAEHGAQPHAALAPLLVARYTGRLGKDDMRILRLLHSLETSTGTSIIATFWSVHCRHDAGAASSLTANPALEILASMNASGIFKTCTSYPRWRALQTRRPQRHASGASSSTTDQAVFDPLFILLLMNAAIIDPNFKGLDILTLLRTNAVSVAVCALSSRCAQLRAYASQILARVRALAEATTFNERGHLLLILDAAKNVNKDEETEPLPLTMSLFLAHSLHALANPALFIHPLFAHFLLQRPVVDETDVPMLYNMLGSASDDAVREREWMLRFLRDCMRAGGRLEWRALKRRHVWELVASAYTAERARSRTSVSVSGRSSMGGGGGGGGTAREVMLAIAELSAAARELLSRRQVLGWIQQAIALEARPRTPGSAFWLRLTVTLVGSRSVVELERLTQGFWAAAVLGILRQCVPASGTMATAADDVGSSGGSPALGVKALQDATALCSLLVHWWHSLDSPRPKVQQAGLVQLTGSLIRHAERLMEDRNALGDDAWTACRGVVRSLFHAVLMLQAAGAPGAADVAVLFPAVLRAALGAGVPEARRLAVRHLSSA